MLPKRTSLTLSLLTLTLICHTYAVSYAYEDDDFGFDLEDENDADDFTIEISPGFLNGKLWHIPDVTAHVGKKFEYQVPRDSLKKANVFEAYEINSQVLPTWLRINKKTGTLTGVPQTSDIGKYHLTIRSVENITSNFTVTVEDNNAGSSYHHSAVTDVTQCGNRKNTVLTIIVDKSFEGITFKERVQAVRNLARFFNQPSGAFKFVAESREQLDEGSIIFAGAGNSRKSKPTGNHAKNQLLNISGIQIVIGCDGNIFKHFVDLIKDVKDQAMDGTISEITQLPIYGWRVAIVKHGTDFSKNRKVREISLTSTEKRNGAEFPLEFYDTANEEEEDEDEEDDFGDDTEEATEIPKTTQTASTESSTKAKHPHRHHHGQNIFEENLEDPVSFVPSDVKIDFIESDLNNRGGSTQVKVVTTPSNNQDVIVSMPDQPDTDKISIVGDDDDEDDEDYGDDNEEDDKEGEGVTEIASNGREPAITTEPTEPRIFDSSNRHLVTSQTAKPSTDVSLVEDPVDPVETSREHGETTVIPKIPFEHDHSSTAETSPMPMTSTVGSSSTTPLPSTTVEVESGANEPTTDSSKSSTETTTTPRTTEQPPETTVIPFWQKIWGTSTIASSLPTSIPIVNETYPDNLDNVNPAPTELDLDNEDDDDIEGTTVGFVASTSTSAPTTGATERRNLAPVIKHRPKKIASTAGKVLSYVLPEDTFMDPDGDKLTLTLLDQNHAPIKRTSWIQFDARTREIYGLPLDEHVSKWEYVIQATDLHGANVSDILEINIQHHKGRRTVTHEFTIEIRVEDRYQFAHQIDWQIRVLRGLTVLFENSALSQITVRHVNVTAPILFTWTHDALPRSFCASTEVGDLLKYLVSDNDGTPSVQLQEALAPEVRVKLVTHRGVGQCETPVTPVSAPPNVVTKNFSPVPRNQIDHINAVVGQLLTHSVPEDSFYDPEDGSARNMKLTLMTMERHAIPANNWLQFDVKNQEFYGIPLQHDQGRKEYQLVCEDSGGLTANDALLVVVHPKPAYTQNATAKFVAKLDTPYDTFSQSALFQRKFVEKLVNLLGYTNANDIVIESIHPGSTVVTWIDGSLSTNRCPHDDILELKRRLVNEDDSITDLAMEIMQPEFTLKSVQVMQTGACLQGKPPVVQVAEFPVHTIVDERKPPARITDDLLLTYIIPGTLIFAMIFLASLVACLLYRRRRRSGKLNMNDEERRSLRSRKGIPVIFQDELEDKPEPGHKTPIIMKEEKPPLPPPEYSKRGDSPDETEPLYQPPPPFPSNRDTRNSRPKATPTYRKPPPYVPP